jgi:quinol monooxygenase YgiN
MAQKSVNLFYRNDCIIIRSVVKQCRDDPGCLSFHLYEDLQEKNALMLEAVWGSDEDLDLHIRSVEYRKLLQVLEMTPKQSEIRFDTILKSTGIETVENIRCHA